MVTYKAAYDSLKTASSFYLKIDELRRQYAGEQWSEDKRRGLSYWRRILCVSEALLEMADGQKEDATELEGNFVEFGINPRELIRRLREKRIGIGKSNADLEKLVRKDLRTLSFRTKYRFRLT